MNCEPAESRTVYSEAIQLARTDVVPGQLPPDRIAATVSLLFRGRIQVNFLPVPACACTWRKWRLSFKRLSRIFLRDDQGRRPVFGGTKNTRPIPHFRDYPLFYEYFHGDNGASNLETGDPEGCRTGRQAASTKRRVKGFDACTDR